MFILADMETDDGMKIFMLVEQNLTLPSFV